MIHNAKELIDNIFGKKVILYGAGGVSNAILSYLEECYTTENIIFLATTEKNKEKCVQGIEVREIKKLLEYRDFLIIIATTEKYSKQIKKQLEILSFNKIKELEDTFCGWLLNRKVPQVEQKSERILWSNALEREIVRENWGRTTQKQDFQHKFIRLIRGLDDESIARIIRILNRQERYLTNDNESLDLFTEEEKVELKLLQQNFYDLIIKLSDNVYAYKNYLLPCLKFSPSVFYYKLGLEKVKTKSTFYGKTIVDVGGYIGDSALILAELEPKQIICFEAVPEHIKLLNDTMKLNNIDNIICENVALGDDNGYVTIHLADSGSTPIYRKGIDFEGEIEVPVITLDEYVELNNIEDIALIKVDIEGGEPAFLRGAKATISKYKPVILLSIYHNAHDFFELKPLIESWNLGYRFKIYKPTDGNITGETILIAEI